MINLSQFDLGAMLRCGLELRRAASEASSMEEAANAIVRYLFEAFSHADGQHQCQLVRFYKTHRYAALEPELQQFAAAMLPEGTPPVPDLRCLTLLATAGTQPLWNSRHLSRGHRAIPLPSEDFVDRAPMIAELIRSFGLSIPEAINPAATPMAIDAGRSYNVFYVPHARDSRFIPAQEDFVIPYGIESVIGFGGRVEDELYAVVLFASVPISRASASRFRTVALDVKTAIYKFDDGSTFDLAERSAHRPT